MEILATVGTIAFLIISSIVGEYLRRNYASKAKLNELYTMESTIRDFVLGAEQKFNIVLDTVEAVSDAKTAKQIKEQRERFNKNKKAYVLANVKRLFPNVDTELLDTLIERMVFEMKEQRAYLNKADEKIIVVNNSGQNSGILDGLRETLEK